MPESHWCAGRAMKMYQFFLCTVVVLVLAGGWAAPAPASLYERMKTAEDLYAQEKYDEALQAYVDAQIDFPDDPQLQYNIAATHYRMRNYEEALTGFQAVAETARDAALEEQSRYNAANCLYKQGKLEAAVAMYRKALELDPQDEDAKRNLDFVLEEIKRRMNEAQKTADQQQQQQGNGEQQGGEQQQGEGQQQQGSGQEQQESGQQQESEQQQQGSGQQQQGDSRQQRGTPDNATIAEADQDRARDGSGGERQEGKERDDRAAGAHPGADDGQEAGRAGSAAAGRGVPMSPEEADRLLNTLQEQRPGPPEQEGGAAGRGAYSGKDW